MTTIVFTCTMQGLPLPVRSGETVTCELPAGCTLRKLQLGVWSVAQPGLYTGPATSFRVDCDVYSSPVTASITISQ